MYPEFYDIYFNTSHLDYHLDENSNSNRVSDDSSEIEEENHNSLKQHNETIIIIFSILFLFSLGAGFLIAGLIQLI